MKRTCWFSPSLALLSVLSAGCQSTDTAAMSTYGAHARDTQAAAVEVVRARQGGLPLVERLTGTVRARQAIVRAPITGRVGQRNVEVGIRVDAQTPRSQAG